MNTFQFFADSGLTVPMWDNTVTQLSGGSPVETVIYFGSPEPDRQLQAASDPGVDPVQITIYDYNPEYEVEAEDLRLALSSGGLDSATPGAPLNLAATLQSGAANAIAVYVRTHTSVTNPGTYWDLALRVDNVVETEA